MAQHKQSKKAKIDALVPVPSPWGVFWGLSPPNKALSPPN